AGRHAVIDRRRRRCAAPILVQVVRSDAEGDKPAHQEIESNNPGTNQATSDQRPRPIPDPASAERTTRSTTRSASPTSSITRILPEKPITTRRSPAGTEQGWKESYPRAHGNNAQPHHRLPGSNSKTGSLRQETLSSASDRARFSRMRGRPRRGPGNSKLR